MTQNKPVIGILPTFPLKEENDPYQDRASFVRMYSKKIQECGGIPIGLLESNISLYTTLCDGYLWPGGNKIWREFYVVFEDVLKNKKPFLGVCLGSQAMATFFNILEDQKKLKKTLEETYQLQKETNPYLTKIGEEQISLHQHYVTKDVETINQARHKIKIVSHSLLESIYQKTEMDVVSLHGIKIARTSESVLVSAHSEDGVIEAVEYTQDGQKILGVQFHPEIEEDSHIFAWLVQAAKNTK